VSGEITDLHIHSFSQRLLLKKEKMTRKSGRGIQSKKVSKLRLNKETVKDLDPKDASATKGGAIGTVQTVTCLAAGCMFTNLTCGGCTAGVCKK
jgi:hypothetical protein